MELSPNSVSVAPLAEAKDTGSSTTQLAITSPPLESPSANSEQSSVVADQRNRPIVCPLPKFCAMVKVSVPPLVKRSVAASKTAVWGDPSLGSIAHPEARSLSIARSLEKIPINTPRQAAGYFLSRG